MLMYPCAIGMQFLGLRVLVDSSFSLLSWSRGRIRRELILLRLPLCSVLGLVACTAKCINTEDAGRAARVQGQ